MTIKSIYHLLKVFVTKNDIPGYNGFELIEWGRGKKENIDFPRNIWMYWETDGKGDSLLVKMCIKRVKELAPQYKLHILNSTTIKNYIDLPDIDFNKLPIAIKADYFRLALLKKYGGIWMDASLLLTRDLKWLEHLYNGQDLIGFYSDECTTNINYPILENWFLCACTENEFVAAWLSEFTDCLRSEDPFNYYNLFLSNSENMQKLSKPQYLLCYVAAMKIMRESDNYEILMIRSGSMGHFYTYYSNWDGDIIAKKLLLENYSASKEYPAMIKFNSGIRKRIDFYLFYKIAKKKSLLGRLLKK